MSVIPFNNRILIQEMANKPVNAGEIYIPDYVKERKNVEKYIKYEIIDVSSDLEEKFGHLRDKHCIVETGMIEEVLIDNKKYIFAPMNYIVCIIEPSNVSENT